MLNFTDYRDLHEKITGGKPAGDLEVHSINEKQAAEYLNDLFKRELGEPIDVVIPDWRKNWKLLKSSIQYATARRIDMPVIGRKQVIDFQRSLQKGKIDIRAPFHPSTNIDNPFPAGLQGGAAKEFLKRGLKDGSKTDDVIKVQEKRVKVGILKPIQKQIYLDKSAETLASFGVEKSRDFLSKNYLIASNDLFIIDGHHRWLSAFILDRNMKLPIMMVDLPVALLLPLATAYGDAIGNKRNN